MALKDAPGYDAERKKAWHEANLEQAALARKAWRYGLTPEQLTQMMLKQEGACAICGRTDLKLVIDHDHGCCPQVSSRSATDRVACGKCVRGLLCGPCNLGLGAFGDDSQRLLDAALYLDRP